MLCGQFASSPDAAAELRKLLRVAGMPVVTTFQGAGIAGRELVSELGTESCGERCVLDGRWERP